MQESAKLIHDMRTETISNLPIDDKTTQLTKEERSFELALPVFVTGMDAVGKKFEENTKLSSISSIEAIFFLKKKVLLGTKLNLTIHIPKTLILENNLQLLLAGEVVFAGSDIKTKGKQLISTQLNRHFKIQSNNSGFQISIK